MGEFFQLNGPANASVTFFWQNFAEMTLKMFKKKKKTLEKLTQHFKNCREVKTSCQHNTRV